MFSRIKIVQSRSNTNFCEMERTRKIDNNSTNLRFETHEITIKILSIILYVYKNNVPVVSKKKL